MKDLKDAHQAAQAQALVEYQKALEGERARHQAAQGQLVADLEVRGRPRTADVAVTLPAAPTASVRPSGGEAAGGTKPGAGAAGPV